MRSRSSYWYTHTGEGIAHKFWYTDENNRHYQDLEYPTLCSLARFTNLIDWQPLNDEEKCTDCVLVDTMLVLSE